MRNALADILIYSRMIARKWVLWLFAALDLVALAAQVVYPAFRFPQLAFLLIMLVGFFWAGYQVYRDIAAQVPSQPIKPAPYEILPLSFDIELRQDIPRIIVWLYVVNHQSRRLDFHSLRVMGFNLSGGPSLDDIALSGEIHVPPRQSRQVLCRRGLSDAEVRSIGSTERRNPVNATFLATAHASVGRSQLRQQTAQLSMNGWISGMPDSP